MELYRWQKECRSAWISQNTRGIANVITGAGKTVLALSCADYLRNYHKNNVHIRIVVPTIPLALQWKRQIMEYFYETEFTEEIGLWYGDVKNSPDKPFMIYVVNSARYSISKHILNDMKYGIHTFLIADECHRYTGESNSLIFSFMKSEQFDKDLYHSLGLSATPYCQKYESVLVPALGAECYKYSVSRAYSDQTVSPFHIIHMAVPLSGEELLNYGDISQRIRITYARLLKENSALKQMDQASFYQWINTMAEEDPESLEALFERLIKQRRKLLYEAEARNRCVIDILRQLPAAEKVLIFTERIEQCEMLYRLLSRRFPGKVGHYHSDLTNEMKKHYLAMFREGENRFLVTCRALDEGLDVPDASTAVVVSSGSVNRQRIQRLGRVLRRSGSKYAAKLYYLFIPNTVDHPYYLDNGDIDSSIIEMSYFPDEHGFSCSEYELLGLALLKQKKHMSDSSQKEIRRCIQKGLLCTDWMLDENQLNELMRRAQTKIERNYYLCMKELSAMRTGK